MARTTYIERFADAVEVMTGRRPDDYLVRDWITHASEELQDWIGIGCHDRIKWVQNIGILDAAAALADSPHEGRPCLMHLTQEETLASKK